MSRPLYLIGSIGLLLASPLQAATYDWTSATNGGLWSEGANWTPAGPPVGGDIANLTDATADRTITYDTAASGTLGTLNFNQTSAFTNTFEVKRALTITNAIVLESTGGTEELKITSPNTNSLTLKADGGITIRSGGRLVLGLGTNSNGDLVNNAVSIVTGNVALGGGQLVVTDSAPGGGAAQRTISGTLSATGGSIAIGASQTVGNREARLQVSGNFSTTNTVISGSGDAQLILDGATNSFGTGTTFANPGTGANTITTVLSGGRDQSLTSETKLNGLFLRQFQDGTFTKTVTVTDQSGPNVGPIQFAGRNNQTIGLKLGSNLRTGTGTQQPVMSGVSQTGANARFFIDTNNFTLELGNTGTSWAPAVSGGAASAVWSLINSGTAGTGGIKVRGVEFNRANVTVNIGAGMVLDLTGGNGVASNLGSAGSIDSTSLIRYSGTALAANPATLTSGRTVGALEIGSGSASGALKLAGSFTAAGPVTVNSFGSFDLGTQTLTADSDVVVESGGILRGGTAVLPGEIIGELTSSGIIAPGTSPAASGVTIGTLSISEGLIMNSDSTLALELVSGTSFDRAIAGSITMNGTVYLSLTLGDGYVHNEGTLFTLLENRGSGPTQGFFTWVGPEGVLQEGELFYVDANPFRITYAGGGGDNNDVVIAAVPEPSAFMALAGAGMLLGLGRARRRR